MSFAVPWMSYVAAAAPLVLAVIYALDFTRRRRALETIGDRNTLLRVLGTMSVKRRVFKAILMVVGMTLLLAALARPQVPGRSVWRRRGIDVAVVYDFSASMLAKDVRPNRLLRAQTEAEILLSRDIPTSRVATVLYAGLTDHFPLTHDHEAGRILFEGVRPGDITQGSDLAKGILVARCLLRPDRADSECDEVTQKAKKRGGRPLSGEPELAPLLGGRDGSERARAMLVFTDGGDASDAARQAMRDAVRADIEVYLIGVGTRAGDLIPQLSPEGELKGWMRDGDGELVTSRLNERFLRELGEISGSEGRFWLLGEGRFPSKQLGQKLSSLREGDFDERAVREPRDIYYWVLFPAFMLLLIEACIRDRRRQA